MKEIKPLTSLRALAALLVFMYHYGVLFSPEARQIAFSGEWIPLMPVWKQGQVGVSIFFVLSGFLITRIYYDNISNRTASLRLFFVKRVARIWPLFLFFTLIQHASMLSGDGSAQSSYLVTLSMTQGFFSDLRYAGLPTAWSLTIEESYYALAPLVFLIIVWLAPRRQSGLGLNWQRFIRLAFAVGTITVVMALLGEVCYRLATSFELTWCGFMGNRHHIIHSTIFGRFPEFAIGIIAAFTHREMDLERLMRGPRATIVVSTSILGIVACMWGKTLLIGNPAARAEIVTLGLVYVLALLAAVLILGLTVCPGPVHRVLSLRLLVYLGKVSYGFYLVQLTVIISPLVTLTDRLGWARLPVLFILTNLLCAAVYEAVEAPSRRWIVSRWGKKSPDKLLVKQARHPGN